MPHLDACFLTVDAGERIVFTNAVDSRWRPAMPEPVTMTAEIVLADHANGTEYRVSSAVRHTTRRHAPVTSNLASPMAGGQSPTSLPFWWSEPGPPVEAHILVVRHPRLDGNDT